MQWQSLVHLNVKRKGFPLLLLTLRKIPTMNFSDIGLSKDLLSSIERAKYESPYPIQIEAIPAILQKKDILGLAPTGSGKTAAYILPILQHLLQQEAPRDRQVPVLVLVPTRELAVQVAEVTENVKIITTYAQQLVDGNLSISGQDYQDWGKATDINLWAYEWAAGKLNLVLVTE